MRQGSIRDTMSIEAEVPRGFAHYWKIIREFDREGSWTIRDIDDQSNARKQDVKDFVTRLLKGGYVEKVGTHETSARSVYVNLYRLIKSPRHYPRLRRDGTELPEPVNERLWRTMKMAKQFTASELAELATDDLIEVKLTTAKSFISHLNKVNVLQVVLKGNATRQARYMLSKNLGAEAPKILRGHFVYDPNSNKIIGEMDVKEVNA